MDYSTRSKIATAMIFRNAPARLREQLMNRGKVQTQEEQEAGAPKRPPTLPGPLTKPRIPQRIRRKH